MVQNYSSERLADFLVDPRESLEFEVKNWLDLKDSKAERATFAKAVLALANHGGGFIVLGLAETELGIVEAEGRPATFDRYGQDLVNSIVTKYCEPSFHCAVHIVAAPDGAQFPIVAVPGGHRIPVRARRAGPDGNIIQNHGIYMRKPGPCSETPTSAQDWETLLARCFHNRRDEFLDQIRDIVKGEVPQVQMTNERANLEKWGDACFVRWKKLVGKLPASVGPRFPHGHYSFAYEIVGEARQVNLAQLPDVIRASVVRHTGWPPFWYPQRAGIVPYANDDAVECWLAGDPSTSVTERDAAHSDFWRIHPAGLAYLLRGYREDAMEPSPSNPWVVSPGILFDLTSPVWQIGETLLQARRLAENLFDGPTTIKFTASYNGLGGRELTSLGGRRNLRQGRVARQSSITLDTHFDVSAIEANLPEIVHPLLSPLYALFDFFELSEQLVADELTRMRSGNF